MLGAQGIGIALTGSYWGPAVGGQSWRLNQEWGWQFTLSLFPGTGPTCLYLLTTQPEAGLIFSVLISAGEQAPREELGQIRENVGKAAQWLQPPCHQDQAAPR